MSLEEQRSGGQEGKLFNKSGDNEIYKKHYNDNSHSSMPPYLYTSFLFIVCLFVYFFNLGNYPLMDVDETRYVSMAKDMFSTRDFLTLYLNNEYFFEKPPLYFWGECLSFAVFGKITEATARFPVALYGTLCCFLTYILGSKIVSKSYGSRNKINVINATLNGLLALKTKEQVAALRGKSVEEI